jgi:hypothetical protein
MAACAACGHQTQPSAIFCGRCGTCLTPAQAHPHPPLPAVQMDARRNRRRMFTNSFIGGILIAASAWFVSAIGSISDTKWWFLAAVAFCPAVCLGLLLVNLTRMFTRRDEFERAKSRGWVIGVLIGIIFTFGSLKRHFLDPIDWERFNRDQKYGIVDRGLYSPVIGRAFVITGTVKETGVPGLYALRETAYLCIRTSGVPLVDGQKIWAVGHGILCKCPEPCNHPDAMDVFFRF